MDVASSPLYLPGRRRWLSARLLIAALVATLALLAPGAVIAAAGSAVSAPADPELAVPFRW